MRITLFSLPFSFELFLMRMREGISCHVTCHCFNYNSNHLISSLFTLIITNNNWECRRMEWVLRLWWCVVEWDECVDEHVCVVSQKESHSGFQTISKCLYSTNITVWTHQGNVVNLLSTLKTIIKQSFLLQWLSCV